MNIAFPRGYPPEEMNLLKILDGVGRKLFLSVSYIFSRRSTSCDVFKVGSINAKFPSCHLRNVKLPIYWPNTKYQFFNN